MNCGNTICLKRNIYHTQSGFCNLNNCKLTRKNFGTSELFESCFEFCPATAAILVACWVIVIACPLFPKKNAGEKLDELTQFTTLVPPVFSFSLLDNSCEWTLWITWPLMLFFELIWNGVFNPTKFYTFLPLKVPFPVLRVKMETAGRLLVYSIFLTKETMNYLPAG